MDIIKFNSGVGTKLSTRKICVKPGTASLQVYCSEHSVSNNRSATPSRMASNVRSNDGPEAKGLVLLIVCGVYALFLFALGGLLSYIAYKVTSPVRAIFFGFTVSEIRPLPSLKSDDNNNQTTYKRTQTRSVSHG